MGVKKLHGAHCCATRSLLWEPQMPSLPHAAEEAWAASHMRRDIIKTCLAEGGCCRLMDICWKRGVSHKAMPLEVPHFVRKPTVSVLEA